MLKTKPFKHLNYPLSLQALNLGRITCICPIWMGGLISLRNAFTILPSCMNYYRNHDDNTFGVDGDTMCFSGPEGEYTAIRGGDCNDGDSAINPGVQEICDGIDNDCDGIVPDDEVDSDRDGFLAWRDCNDKDATIYPGAP